MKKTQLMIQTFLAAAVFSTWAAPAEAIWPVIDIPVLTTNISSYVSTVQATLNTIESTLSIGKIQQAIGDASGPLLTFLDQAENAAKRAEERIEREKKEAQRRQDIIEDLKKKAGLSDPSNPAPSESSNNNPAPSNSNSAPSNNVTGPSSSPDPFINPSELLSAQPSNNTAPSTGSQTTQEPAQNEPLPASARTSFKKASYSRHWPLAFAQYRIIGISKEGSEDSSGDSSGDGGVKYYSGATKDGRFVISARILRECEFSIDDFDEETVFECVKKWVLLMHDENASKATEYRNQWVDAMGDQTANAVGTSMQHKNYTATFNESIADDLQEKSQMVTSERDILAYQGEINRVNQEVLRRMMDVYSTQILTEALHEVSSLDPSYFAEDEDWKE